MQLSRTRRNAPPQEASCAADPGPPRAPVLDTVPALRNGIAAMQGHRLRMPHFVRDTCWFTEQACDT